MALEIVGHAIVSADGMIADRDHKMPAALRNDADWRRFQAALDRAVLVVLGRIGHEAHPNPGRKRLVVTSRVAWLERAPGDDHTMLWNPSGIGLRRVLAGLGIADGVVAVTGGQRVFDLFLPGFTSFELVTVAGLAIPDGVPCFSGGLPWDVLAQAGLRAAETEELDAGVSLTVWRRP
ncbi:MULTISPECIES: dihydrofolate reductase [unclassified Devosia]|uniref:dihydrofolate reductase n=1 Tax=unclassified Devosia TaxID=196773 RepID=UPI001AC4CDDC|nr:MULTISPECIES: dihydrofolate reductase [unclassified Devosia]MBN9305959.1 dihydrofolate reductase [Devosia sp.]